MRNSNKVPYRVRYKRSLLYIPTLPMDSLKFLYELLNSTKPLLLNLINISEEIIGISNTKMQSGLFLYLVFEQMLHPNPLSAVFINHTHA